MIKEETLICFNLENLRLYDKRLKKLYYSKCNEKRKVPGRIFSRTEEYNLSASLTKVLCKPLENFNSIENLKY